MKDRVAVNIDLAMTAAEVTNADLARKMGKDPREIRRWRNGEVTPGEENLAAIAMGCAIDDLTWFYLPHGEEPEAA